MPDQEFKAGPEGGGETTKFKDRAKVKYKYVSQRVASLIWIGTNGYLLYAFCYVVLWRHVRFRNRGAAIAILALFCVINFFALMSFVALHAWGPGKITPSYTKNTEADPDSAFLCDEQGYSLYCSYCKHIKPNRTHHASFTNTCVPIMDHFCPWVGNVIGQGNLKFFLQFAWSTFLGLLLIMITLFIYQHDQIPHINGNSIALYIVCTLAGLFLFCLIGQHSFYVLWTHTTLEHMGYRRGNVPCINLLWRDGQRRVVRPDQKEIVMPRASPFDHGIWNNIRHVMGPWYTWLLPIREPIREPEISPKFLAILKERIKE